MRGGDDLTGLGVDEVVSKLEDLAGAVPGWIQLGGATVRTLRLDRTIGLQAAKDTIREKLATL